jgi:AcrR family transcriptional regulator
MGRVTSSQRRASRTPRDIRVPQQARSRRTRERILEAATDSFETLGYDETTTAEIARRAGIAVGSVYDYFRDKRAILLELVHDTVEQVADLVVQGLAPETWRDADRRESVRKLLELIFHSRTVRPGLQRILWERFFKDPEVRAAVEAIEERVRGAVATLLETLRADGRTRIDDPTTAAFVVHLSVEWTASRLVLGGAPVDIDQAVDAATDMIARYIFEDA